MSEILLAFPLLSYIVMKYLLPKYLGGTPYMLATALAWLALIYLTIRTLKREGVNILQWRQDQEYTAASTFTGMIQLTIFTLMGFISSFGKNPLKFRSPVSLIVTLLLFASELVAVEVMRAAILQRSSKKDTLNYVILTAMIFTLHKFPISKYTSINSGNFMIFLAQDFLIVFSQNVLLSVFTILGGASASIPYIGLLSVYEWVSPIQPKPPWVLKTFTYILIPLFGFLYMVYTEKPIRLYKRGLIDFKELRESKRSNTVDLSWVSVSLLCLLIVWGSTGLFGPKPSVVVSGSMQPAVMVGDIAITWPVDSAEIQVGDVILYQTGQTAVPILHRVIEINEYNGRYNAITKGDANEASDNPIVLPEKTHKMVYVVPKLGWVTITLRQALYKVYTFITGLLPAPPEPLNATLTNSTG